MDDLKSKWIVDGKVGAFLCEDEVKNCMHALEHMIAIKKYDDSFLLTVIRLHELWPESEKYELYYAKYAFYHHNLDVALEYAIKACRKKKVSLEIWRLMVDIYREMKDSHSMWFYDALCCKHYGTALCLEIPRASFEMFRTISSHAMSEPWKAPELTGKLTFGEDGMKQENAYLLIGQFLPQWPWKKNSSGFHPWCGIWNLCSEKNFRGKMLEKFASNGIVDGFCYYDIVFDIMKSRKANSVEVSEENGQEFVLPLAGTEADQKLYFESDQLRKDVSLGKFEYTYFRLNSTTKISSEKDFLMGQPVVLIHSPRRLKFVLNILVDGFSWSEAKRQKYRCIPNMMRYFGDGIIFDNHYSVAEYTYPSLATIETGCMTPKIQIFNPRAMVKLSDEYRTISERMKEAGYYCTNVMGGGEGVYNGVTRGYDRILVSQATPLHAYEGIERLMDYMSAFHECDNFLFLHISDTHPNGNSKPLLLETQTELSLEDRCEIENDVVSVWLDKSKVNVHQNRLNIRKVDRLLGHLFDWIEERYREDEYVVHLYSDHGASVYSDQPWFLSEDQTHAAFMVRGKGVPHLGKVEELTSCVDIHPSVLRNAGLDPENGIDGNLPAALGGKERAYVISNSIYPLQTFKLCIRDKNYEFRMETEDATDIDGTVDFSKFFYAIYTRDEAHVLVNDEIVEQRFLHIAEEYTRSVRNWRRKS